IIIFSGCPLQRLDPSIVEKSCHHDDPEKARGWLLDREGSRHETHLHSSRIWENLLENSCQPMGRNSFSTAKYSEQCAKGIPQSCLHTPMHCNCPKHLRIRY